MALRQESFWVKSKFWIKLIANSSLNKASFGNLTVTLKSNFPWETVPGAESNILKFLYWNDSDTKKINNWKQNDQKATELLDCNFYVVCKSNGHAMSKKLSLHQFLDSMKAGYSSKQTSRNIGKLLNQEM